MCCVLSTTTYMVWMESCLPKPHLLTQFSLYRFASINCGLYYDMAS